jgi:hypothetical protein
MEKEPEGKQSHEKTTLKRKLILAAAFVVVFFIGIGIGASGKTKTVTTAAKTVTAPAKTVPAQLLRQTASQRLARQRASQRLARQRASQRLAAAKSAKTKSSERNEVVFSVTGTAPGGVDITYGDDGSNYQGSAPPFHARLRIKKGAMYYVVTAQLQGGGNITCRVTIGRAVKVSHAVGGYNICSAQLNSDFLGGWD